MYFSYGCNISGITAAYISFQPPTGRAMGWHNLTLTQGWSPDFRCRQVTSVKSPSEFMIMADTAADAVYDFAVLPTDSQQSLNWRITTIPGKVHRGGANVCLRWHVQWYLQKDLVCKDPPVLEELSKQRMWNADNLSAWGHE